MQKEIQLTDKTLLVVGFNTTNPIFIQSGITSEDPIAFKLEYNLASTETIVIPKGDWQLLGIYPELTEEQAITINATPAIMPKFGYRYEYVSALESFQSLMEREKCYTVNPLKFDPTGITTGEWQEAQQTTFDKYAILIKSK